jgi:hypothetical protein
MELDSPRAYWIDVVGLALASVVMFRFGLLRLLFLVPIQLVWIRRGEYAALISSGISLVAMSAVSAVSLARIGELSGGSLGSLVLLDLVFVLGMLAGLFVLNSRRLVIRAGDGHRELTVPERMIAVVVAGLAIFGPVIWLISRGDGANAIIAAQIEIVRPLLQAAGASTEEVRALTEMVVGALLSGVLFGYLLLVAGNWWFGLLVAFRTRLRLPEGNPVMARLASYTPTQFALPVWFVWALIGAWAGVLASITLELGSVSYVFWNAGFVTLAIYAMQGISILLHFAERRKLQRGMRMGMAVALVFGLLVPGLNFVVGLGLPLLGVSEIWIDYHRLKGSEEK